MIGYRFADFIVTGRHVPQDQLHEHENSIVDDSDEGDFDETGARRPTDEDISDDDDNDNNIHTNIMKTTPNRRGTNVNNIIPQSNRSATSTSTAGRTNNQQLRRTSRQPSTSRPTPPNNRARDRISSNEPSTSRTATLRYAQVEISDDE